MNLGRTNRKMKIITAFIQHIREDGGKFTSLDAYDWILQNCRYKSVSLTPLQVAGILARVPNKKKLGYRVLRARDGKQGWNHLVVYEVIR